MSITIRQEKSSDNERLHNLIVTAFHHAAYSEHNEQIIVEALRNAQALTVSLVAQESDEIVGHVAVSPVEISDGSEGWFGLGPISVEPAKQGNGIGSKLMVAALSALKDIDAQGCVLLGDPEFYQRFGFKPVNGLTLADVPPEYFQALVLQGTCPQGEVFYHSSFSANS